MSYKIIADSCCDRLAVMSQWDNIAFVPLTLELGDYSIPDDENFDQDDFIKRTLAYHDVAKTACPSPAAWANAMDCEEEELYIITITDKLSGTYNSALQGVDLYNEEHPDNNKKIHVFNSLSTSGTESLIALKIKELADMGTAFEETVEIVEDYIVNHTALYFCLESFDVLRKNGRTYAVAAGILQKLRVKLIMERTKEGNISPVGQAIAMNMALVKMAGCIAKDVEGCDVSDKKLIISHVCCEDRAKLLAEKIRQNVNFGDIEIVKCSGLNSTYASNGGIIVSYSK